MTTQAPQTTIGHRHQTNKIMTDYSIFSIHQIVLATIYINQNQNPGKI